MPRKGAVAKETCCICCQQVTVEKDEALYCSGKCQQWLHRYCASVTVEQYKNINDKATEFQCPSCCRERHQQQICELTGTVEAMKIEIAQLKESLAGLTVYSLLTIRNWAMKD